ncbi:MAG: Crp/Fnr family transcriptional regulator [Anaerolineae bacterium]|nr:Crp/Fnr family transcriptional regulator [Caldilineales bacterium]MDW8267585.1 Crp/Fnr family transcriptional regulator [Anaerolineae bacterium]
MKDLPSPITNEQIPELFAQLPHEDPAFGRAVTILRVPPGELVATPAELNQNLYILMSGVVHLVATNKEGRSLAMATLGPGSVFGENALLDLGQSTTMSAQAITPCVVWKLGAEQAQTFADRHPILSLGMLRTFGRRLIQVENRLEDVAYRNLPERLAAEILRQQRHAHSNQIRISHQALADILGTYRETISAILRDFKRENWVELGYRRIIIKDPEALARLAGAVYE